MRLRRLCVKIPQTQNVFQFSFLQPLTFSFSYTNITAHHLAARTGADPSIIGVVAFVWHSVLAGDRLTTKHLEVM